MGLGRDYTATPTGARSPERLLVSLQHCVGAKASLTRRSRDVEEPRRSHVLALKSALLVGLQPVKQCYSTLLEQDPTAEGAFSIRMKIRRGRDGKGELADANVRVA